MNKYLIYISCFLAINLEAQINWLSDGRFLAISNYAEVVGQTAPSNYSATAFPPMQFAPFSGQITQIVESVAIPGSLFAYSSALASEESSMTSSQFSLTARTYAVTWGGPRYDIAPEACYAEADSVCELTFSVDSPQLWNLETPMLKAEGLVTIDLFSAQYGLLSGKQGILQPGDIYTLDVSLVSDTSIPDYLGHDVYNLVTVDFSVEPVPEPGSCGLISAGLVAMSLQFPRNYRLRHFFGKKP